MKENLFFHIRQLYRIDITLHLHQSKINAM